jgi:crotonobetainyl-CoA:carnitine CoA-transferase CaiB-like acyl-CoA transferase
LLSPYRILDLCDERGAMAGRILADLGAEVIRIEPAGGDPLRRRGTQVENAAVGEGGLAWLAAQAGKRGIVLDLAGDAGDRATFRALAAGADAVIETFRPGELAALGLDHASVIAGLPASHPGLVWCSITPFGQSGPYAAYAGHDLVCVAMGGNASMTGDPDRPPLRCSLPTAYMHGGPEAVVGVLLGLFGRGDLGRGQHVDVSLQETQLATLISAAGQVASGGPLRERAGFRTGRTREIWRCRDGFVSYGLRGGPARAGSLRATVEYMAESGLAPDWLRAIDWADYSPFSLEDAALARLEAAFASFFETRTMRELYEESLARRILLAPCNDAREILAQAQLRARGFFARVAPPAADPSAGAVVANDGRAGVELPGAFARASASTIGVRGPAPRLDQHGARLRDELMRAPRRAAEPRRAATSRLRTHAGPRGVLEGLRVLEFGSGAAGPVATRYLAEQGATVIRVESAKRPDFLRLLHVTSENRGEPEILERAPMFVLLNPDKQSLALDLKTEEGVALALRLVDEWADVVAENFAPGVMEGFGLGAEDLLARRPDLVMVSGCLFGQTGPQRRYPGFGGQGAAIAGFNHMTGWPDREALGPYATITDSLSPRFVCATLLAALLHLRRTGEGQSIDVSQIETGVYALSEMVARHSATGEVMIRNGNRSDDQAPHGIYPCRDADASGPAQERWIAIAVQSDEAWMRLVEAMDRPGWAMDPRLATTAGRLVAVDAIETALSAWTRGQNAESLMDVLQRVGVEAGVVRDLAELARDPQLAVRGHFVRCTHPVLGKLAFERSGFRLSETPGGIERAGPRLGEHTHAILGDLLGMSEVEIADLRARGITT